MKSSTLQRALFVTGGASGIGYSLTKLAASQNQTVISVDKSDRIRELFHEFPSVHTIVANHRVEADIRTVVDEMRQKKIIPQHLALIAGGCLSEELTVNESAGLSDIRIFRESMDQNFFGHMEIIQALLPEMIPHSLTMDCSITLCSSINALQGWGEPAYSSAKSAIHGFVVSACEILGRMNIRVNGLAPGTVNTPLIRKEYASSPLHIDNMKNSSALGRIAEPEQIADVFLAIAYQFTHLTGQVLVIDGGQSVKR